MASGAGAGVARDVGLAPSNPANRVGVDVDVAVDAIALRVAPAAGHQVVAGLTAMLCAGVLTKPAGGMEADARRRGRRSRPTRPSQIMAISAERLRAVTAGALAWIGASLQGMKSGVARRVDGGGHHQPAVATVAFRLLMAPRAGAGGGQSAGPVAMQESRPVGVLWDSLSRFPHPKDLRWQRALSGLVEPVRELFRHQLPRLGSGDENYVVRRSQVGYGDAQAGDQGN